MLIEAENEDFFRALEEAPMSMTDGGMVPDDGGDDGGIPTPTVWDLVTSRPDEFSTFISLIELIDAEAVLQDREKEWTVFVPTDDAFAAVQPSDLLSKYLDIDAWGTRHLDTILTYMVIDKALLSTDLEDGAVLKPTQTLIPNDLTVALPPPQLLAPGMPVPANIIEVDHVAENGVVHVIDQVLIHSFLRITAGQAAIGSGLFNIVVELFEIADLMDVLNGPGPATIFAPPDAVFEAYGEDFINQLRNDPEGTRTILLNHVVLDKNVCACNNETVVSAAGFELSIERFSETSGYAVNGVASAPGFGITFVTNNGITGALSNILFPPQ